MSATTRTNPFGLGTVTPYLAVQDVAGVLQFAEVILGATARGEPQRREDGSIQHAEVTIGDSVVMLGEPRSTDETRPGMLYVYVDDCDRVYARALESGATTVLPPEDYPHGDRYGGVEDAAGNVWWLVTHRTEE
ncbi:MAG: VOC family protein [Longimicrobiales bacterium]